MWIKLKRTFRAGAKNFTRNGWLSVATVSVMVITLFVVNLQLAIIGANDLRLKDVQNRVNISVEINPKTSLSQVNEFQRDIQSYDEVLSVELVDKDEALKEFKSFTQSGSTIQSGIETLGENFLYDTLIVRTHNPSQYENVVKKIESGGFSKYVEEINYHKYRAIIDGLTSEIETTRKFSLTLAFTLSLVAILVTFNSIRITMYSHKQEIEIMKLVGASNNYVRLPFVWEGIFYGIAAALIAVPLSFAYLKFITNGDATSSVFAFSNTKFLKEFLSVYFVKNIFIIIPAQFAFGVLLGVMSSLIAMRRYLKEL
ncbi:ABC transporter permease [bacterium]|jgi:cell division transport system permease protein|nr:ABC transporter permease [bacterium]MBT4251281.1 ABC transporter permease [bacterium]MBT4598338.1 ABC transporter permease [bacterium]MBT6754171.1 ABC transporter permease [bacterium]MBT7037229.1 ABC transporter permease [bacterium]